MRRRRKKRERIPWEVRPTVAPGDLSLVQAFVNTVDRKVDNDELASPESLAAWLSHRRLLPREAELGRAELRRALEVREALRALLAANNGATLVSEAVERLDRAARAARHQLRFGRGGAACLPGVRYRLKVAPRAEAQTREDLEKAFDLISLLPRAGQPIRHSRIGELRRLLMGRVRYYLYYSVDDETETVEVLALWHASTGVWGKLQPDVT